MLDKEQAEASLITRPKVKGNQIDHSSVEATLRGSGLLENPTILQKLKERVGFDMLRPKAGYDWELTTHLLETLVPEILGWEGTPGEKLFRVGCCTFEGWGETILGRILTAPISRSTPNRALELMARNMSLSPFFGQHELKKLGPTDYLFVANNDPRHPEFVAGLLVPVLLHTGITDPTWQVEHTNVDCYKIQISWHAPTP